MKTLRYLLLVGLIILSILPAAVVGAKDNDNAQSNDKDNPRFGTNITASFKVTKLGEGTVTPIGDYPTNFKWLVKDRPVEGTVSGYFDGTFKFVYSGILNPDQSGNIAGEMTINSRHGSLSGPLMDTVTAPQFAGVNAANGQTVMLSTIKDCKVFLINGKKGFQNIDINGQLDGQMYIMLDVNNEHVQAVLNGETVYNPYTGQSFLASSVMNLTGKTLKSVPPKQPKR